MGTTSFPPLDSECERCGGEGEIDGSVVRPCGERYRETCYECDGIGTKLTEFGKAVMSVVRQRLVLAVRWGEDD